MKTTHLLLGVCLLTGAAHATTIEFVPPNDTTGAVYTTNDNDGYTEGRGLVFRSTTAQVIDSIGIFLDVSNVLLNWVIYQTTGVTGDLTLGQMSLASGSVTANTTGLQWVDISTPTVNLVANGTYHIQFTHSGTANQNFYYNNDNTVWTQGVFQALDGTGNGDTGNSVVAAIRLNANAATDPDPSGVPEPATIWMTAAAGGLLVARRLVRY